MSSSKSGELRFRAPVGAIFLARGPPEDETRSCWQQPGPASATRASPLSSSSSSTSGLGTSSLLWAGKKDFFFLKNIGKKIGQLKKLFFCGIYNTILRLLQATVFEDVRKKWRPLCRKKNKGVKEDLVTRMSRDGLTWYVNMWGKIWCWNFLFLILVVLQNRSNNSNYSNRILERKHFPPALSLIFFNLRSRLGPVGYLIFIFFCWLGSLFLSLSATSQGAHPGQIFPGQLCPGTTLSRDKGVSLFCPAKISLTVSLSLSLSLSPLSLSLSLSLSTSVCVNLEQAGTPV